MSEELDRSLPHSPDAERAILGALLIDGARVYSRIAPIVAPADFFDERHRMLYGLMARMVGEGLEVDLLTVQDDLRTRGRRDAAGGVVYVSSLTDGIPDMMHIERYAQIVARDAKLRRLVVSGNAMMRAALEGGDPAEIAAGVADSLSLAAAGGPKESQLVPVAEIENMLERYYVEGVPRGLSTGWPSLDRLFTVRKGEFTVVTGIPGHGKTSFLDALLVNLATLHGFRCGLFSAENLPLERHASGLAEKIAGKYFGRPGDDFRMTTGQLAHSATFIRKHFRFIRASEDGQNLDSIFEAMREFVDEGMDVIVLDPWNEIDHAIPTGTTETDYVDTSLRRLRRFARFHVVHLFVVVHPAKLRRESNGSYPVPTLYDCHGSAHWRNKADNGIVVWRDMLDETAGTSIYVQKIRFREVGKVGTCVLHYQHVSGRYADRGTADEPVQETNEATLFASGGSNG